VTGFKGSSWLQCEGQRRKEGDSSRASAITQAAGDGGLNYSGHRKVASGITLNRKSTAESTVK